MTACCGHLYCLDVNSPVLLFRNERRAKDPHGSFRLLTRCASLIILAHVTISTWCHEKERYQAWALLEESWPLAWVTILVTDVTEQISRRRGRGSLHRIVPRGGVAVVNPINLVVGNHNAAATSCQYAK